MDTGTFRGLITLFLLIAFIAIVVWAYSKRRRDAFDEAANLPFADEEPELPSQTNAPRPPGNDDDREARR